MELDKEEIKNRVRVLKKLREESSLYFGNPSKMKSIAERNIDLLLK